MQAGHTRWLNEEPPTENNPGGKIIETALAGFLPREDERVPPDIRVRVNRTNNAGTRWLQSRHQNVELASLVRNAFEDAERKEDLPLVELVEWALSRGDRRQDLVPLVLTEKGVRKPADALLADPLVEGGESRRQLFPDKPALVENYASIEERHAVVLFLMRLGVCGGAKLNEQSTWFGRYRQGSVANLIGIDEQKLEPANNGGYTVLDYRFPFRVKNVALDALQDWLSREHGVLSGKGRRNARSYYHYERRTPGTNPATWVRELQEHPWVLCTDGHRRRPEDVLLDPDPDFEEAPIADIDSGLAGRLTAEGMRFGSGVPKSPILRRVARRGTSDMPDSELAALLQEAREQVENGEATRNELLRALGDVRLRGVPLLSRVVERSGAGSGQRSDLGGWVVALSNVEHSLAAAVGDLQLPIPETTTGRQALDFLYDIWERKPERVENIRGHLAAAYRYLLDDMDRGKLPSAEWRLAREHVHLYGQDGWLPIGKDIVVDDVQSPLIRKFLPKGKSVVASHLGDSNDQIRRVATALGLGLLSDEVEVSRGSRADDPGGIVRLRQLVEMLALLEGRRELREVAFHDLILLRVDGTEHSISAYVDDGALLLAGAPSHFAAEAAEQLVEHFRLSQRGNVIPFLTAALFVLEDAAAFQYYLELLAEGLEVRLPEGTPEPEIDDVPSQTDEPEPIDQPIEDAPAESHPSPRDEDDVPVEDPVTGPNRSPQVPTDTAPAHEEPQRHPVHDDRRTKRPFQTDRPASRRPAADHFMLLMMTYDRSEESESISTPSGPDGVKDDQKARQVVIEYETSQGRLAEAMPDLQPGFDVYSVDPSTGNRRRIEVKGVQGIFEEDASVVLTARQVHDALGTVEDGVEYWLYVVDSTEAACPRVFPIPWTQYRTRLRYGFYARAWAGAAEQPAGGT